ncbi:hypothetical protein Tco_0992870 [Tanacetum coccineum]|uniref:Retroviral polymerase SH3-like domain-containing protein n=1 Tax=Tanacetum coccineum TaxID=301880 RepID=A0ABQ5F3B6_9ASTR
MEAFNPFFDTQNAILQYQKIEPPVRSLFSEVSFAQNKLGPFRNLSVSVLSSPAVQQLWTLYPGKQTANLMTNTQTPPPATTVVIPTGAPVTNTVANQAKEPEKFNGQNFKRWQQKMFFYLTTLGLARFLKETVPQVETSPYLFNHCVPSRPRTAKELWTSMNASTRTEDAVQRNFELAPVIGIQDVLSKSCGQSGLYTRPADVVVRHRNEEDNKLAQKDTYTPESAKANMVEHAGSSSRFNSKGNKKDKRKNDKKGKGKSLTSNCKIPKRAKPSQANRVNMMVDMIAMVVCVVAMTLWLSTERLTMDKEWYKGISATLLISREQEMLLKMTIRERAQSLTNVLYFPAIRQEILCRLAVKQSLVFVLVFESDKLYTSDRGGEKLGSIRTSFVAKHGIDMSSTAPYSPRAKRLAKVAVPPPKAQKIGPKSVDCIFIGYAKKSTAYRFIVHESKNPDIQKNTIMESRNASFFENIFPGAAISIEVYQAKLFIAKSTMESEFIALRINAEKRRNGYGQVRRELPRWPKPYENHPLREEVGTASKGIVGAQFLRALAEPC